MKPLKPDRLGLIDPKTGRFVNPEFQALVEEFFEKKKDAGLEVVVTCLIIFLGIAWSNWFGRIMGIPLPPPIEPTDPTGVQQG